MNNHAQPTLSSAAASQRGAAIHALELLEARQRRDALKALLREEQAAMADFLVSLAEFDLRRGWATLGHANLFAFITSELGLSPAPTYWRQEAARLLQRFPDLAEPLRQGELCLTTMAELAKVLTAENREAVLPRFLGISSREAKEIVAELQPREAPATRTVVTRLPEAAVAWIPGNSADARLDEGGVAGLDESSVSTSPLATGALPSLFPRTPTGAPPSQLWAPKVDFGGAARSVATPDQIEPLSSDRSRIHVNVSRQFTRKLEAARRGLGHSIPHATMEQALEAALDLLLEKQARARGQVKRPQAALDVAVSRPEAPEVARSGAQGATPPLALCPSEPPPPRRTGPREAIPAAVRRAVWERDEGRCQWPLVTGGRCGSTHRLELDHIVPWARDGRPTEANLRLLCHRHNALAAQREFGAHVMKRYSGRT